MSTANGPFYQPINQFIVYKGEIIPTSYQSSAVTEDITIMITRPFLLMVVCLGLIIIVQSFVPKAMAMQRYSNIDEFGLEHETARKRKNYALQLARDSDLGSMGVSYDTEPLDPNTNPEELSALMVDYANMMRNGVVMLDNSVETRTRKRGNIKVDNYNHAIPDPPCTCKYINDTKDFGEHAIPRFVKIRNCSNLQQQNCKPPYVCKENLYNVTILRRREYTNQYTVLELPNDIKHRWVAEVYSVSVGCECTNEYLV